VKELQGERKEPSSGTRGVGAEDRLGELVALSARGDPGGGDHIQVLCGSGNADKKASRGARGQRDGSALVRRQREEHHSGKGVILPLKKNKGAGQRRLTNRGPSESWARGMDGLCD